MATKKARQLLTLIALGSSFQASAGELLDVTVIGRQDNASGYTYVVPGYSNSQSYGNANCSAYGNSANCNGNVNTSTVSSPGFAGSYEVHGATLSLKLPDGRIAVVNCASKVNLTEWSNPNRYRSCRIPLVNQIKAEFLGDSAKLKWPVSIDGKKLQHETIRLLPCWTLERVMDFAG
jgi:hypothetical protein